MVKVAYSFRAAASNTPRSISICICLVTLTLCFVMLNYRGGLPIPQVSDELSAASLRKSTIVEKCLLYDRPMRTGSTTITNALRACVKKRKWKMAPRVKEGQFHKAVQGAVGRRAHKVALMQHMWISDTDVRMLYERCGELFYISSTAKLVDQVWSAAKMLSNERRNGNSSLDDEKTNDALEWLHGNARAYIDMYEFYPHIRALAPLEKQPDGRFPDIPPAFERIDVPLPFDPDYVIRKEFMQEDLAKLLEAMGCDASFSSMNVHAVSESDVAAEEALMKRVREASQAGDGASYTRLMRIGAESNEIGLRKIRELMDS